MKILVTGGGGFLGYGLSAALHARGYEVISLQRSHSTQLDALGIRQIRGDIADAATVMMACDGVEAIFHNAAKAGHWGSYESYYQPNVVGTNNILAACRAQQIRKLVYTSSPSVTHNARVPCAGKNEEDMPYPAKFKAHYPATKMIAEKAVIAANGAELATVSLRPRLIWGPGDNNLLPRLVERAQAGRLRLIAGGHNQLDTTYIDNAVNAHLLAFDALSINADCAGKAYFISNGEPKSVAEVVNSLLGAAGEPPVTQTLPLPLAYGIGALCEVLWPVLRLKREPPLTRFAAEQLSTTHWYDISAAKRDFGYRPQVSFAEGIQKLSQWWASVKHSR